MKTGTCPYTVRTKVHFYGTDKYPATTIEVADRDPNKVVIPDRAYAFVFYDEVTATVEIHGRLIVLTCQDEQARFGKLNQSATHYCGGQLYSFEDGERLFKQHESVLPVEEEMGYISPDDLFDNIRKDKYPDATHVIQCRDGNIRPFRQGTNVIVPLPEMAT